MAKRKGKPQGPKKIAVQRKLQQERKTTRTVVKNRDSNLERGVKSKAVITPPSKVKVRGSFDQKRLQCSTEDDVKTTPRDNYGEETR